MSWMKKYHIIGLIVIGGVVSGFSQIHLLSQTPKGAGIKVYTYTKQFANLYVVHKEGRYLMIDAGIPNDSIGLLSFFEKHQIPPEKIEYLILTHAHPDHAGNAEFLQRKFGIKVIAGAGDLQMIKAAGYDPYLCPRGLQGKIIENTIARKRYATFTPDVTISQNQGLSQFGWEGKIHLFKSHTAGSLVVMMHNIAFVGDLIKGKSLNKTKPSFHIFMCDLSENLKDIQAIAQNEATHQWYLGHMKPVSRKSVLEFINKNKKYD